MSTVAQENYAHWSYYRNLALNTGTGGAVVPGNVIQFPLLLRMSPAHADVFATSKGRGADLRFAKANGRHLKYQIERWDSAGNSAAVWVLVDTVYGNNAAQSLRMYCGKTGTNTGTTAITGLIGEGRNFGGANVAGSDTTFLRMQITATVSISDGYPPPFSSQKESGKLGTRFQIATPYRLNNQGRDLRGKATR